jgi:hypothetical protein
VFDCSENKMLAGQNAGLSDGFINKTKKAIPSPIKIGESKNFKDLSTRK